MKRLIVTMLLLFGFALSANADVWKWVDASGKTHFVDTTKPIYTWSEIYDSSVNAPQLYRTGESGEREYLSKQEGDAIIAETKAKKDELCK
jgi:hypothetical protein